MHSHDRTLLAKLGFADIDRQHPRHDLACQYLAQPSVAQKLLRTVFPDLVPVQQAQQSLKLSRTGSWVGYKPIAGHDRGFRPDQTVTVTVTCSGVELSRATFEYHLTKGDGKYQTTIGFLDLVLQGKCNLQKEWTEAVHYRPFRVDSPDIHVEQLDEKSNEGIEKYIVTEIKIHPVPASEVIRQIKLYAEYFPVDKSHASFALVTEYSVSARELGMFKNEGIHVFELGEAFDTWAKAGPDRDQQPAIKATTL